MKGVCAFNLLSTCISRGTITHIPSVFHVAVPAGLYPFKGGDPGFEKEGGAGVSRARPQDFFGQFRGLFKQFAPPSGFAPVNL